MNSPRILHLSIGLLLGAALLPSRSVAQRWTFGLGLTQIVGSGDGVGHDCLESGYSSGIGFRIAAPILNSRTAVQFSGRGYALQQGSTCVDGFPPSSGVFVEDDRINLTSQSFATTDLRLATRLGAGKTVVAVGLGNAWHKGHDLPYLVFAAGVALVDQPGVQLSLEGEVQWLRVTADRFRRTYQNFQLVSEESLGRTHSLSHAIVIGLHLGVPL